MKRRGFIATMGMAAFAGCEQTEGVQEELTEPQYDILLGVEWTNDEKALLVTFPEEHDAEFLAVVHEYDDETVLWSDDAPRFRGPVEVPMLDAVSCDGAEYPTQVFELVTGTGTTNLGWVEEVMERRSVEVEQEWMSRAREHEVPQHECMTFPVQ